MPTGRLRLFVFVFLLGTPAAALVVVDRLAPWWIALLPVIPVWYAVLAGTLHAYRDATQTRPPGPITLEQAAAERQVLRARSALDRAQAAHVTAIDELRAAYAPAPDSPPSRWARLRRGRTRA